MTHDKNNLLFSLLLLIVLTGCSGAKEQLGLTRTLPDEFAVVKRAPLALPPDYNLRPPAPGAPRPQEEATDAQARQVVTGETPQEAQALEDKHAARGDEVSRAKAVLEQMQQSQSAEAQR